MSRQRKIMGVIVVLVVLIVAISLILINAYKTENQENLNANLQTYNNPVYGYGFTYPANLNAIEYSNDLMGVSTTTPDGNVLTAFDSGVYLASSTASSSDFADFVFQRAKSFCDADGPGASISCDKIINNEPFTSASGVLGEKITLDKVTKNTVTNEKRYEDYGPIYAFDISRNVDSGNMAIVLIHPPFTFVPFENLKNPASMLSLAADSFILSDPTEYSSSSTSTVSKKRRPAPEDVSLNQGQTVEGAGLNITFNRIVQDDRCFTKSQCTQTGAITGNFTFMSGDKRVVQNYSSDSVPLRVLGYNVSIIDSNPARYLGQSIPQSAYSVTLHVSPM